MRYASMTERLASEGSDGWGTLFEAWQALASLEQDMFETGIRRLESVAPVGLFVEPFERRFVALDDRDHYLAVATDAGFTPMQESAQRPTADEGRLQFRRGRELLATRGCMTCHTFTGVPAIPASPLPTPLEGEALEAALIMAPDLRYTRQRMRTSALLAWLADPGALNACALEQRHRIPPESPKCSADQDDEDCSIAVSGHVCVP